jgi:hypothetical protein
MKLQKKVAVVTGAARGIGLTLDKTESKRWVPTVQKGGMQPALIGRGRGPLLQRVYRPASRPNRAGLK